MVNIKTVDLNLLVTLDTLLSELNVSRAARKLNLSQPSVSAQLARLRHIFNDPLLLPGPRGMQATARADALRAPLKEALETLHKVISNQPVFNPATAQKTWHIAASDYSETTIFLPLVNALRKAAPMSRLAIRNLEPQTLGRLADQGEIDMAFHTCPEAPPHMRHKTLLKENYVLTMRKDHPQIENATKLDGFCSLEHVIVSPNGGGFHAATDEALQTIGRTRKVVLSVPHFLVARHIIETSDLVGVLPARLVSSCDTLATFIPPLEVSGFEIAMLWHERLHRDPAHQWLRQFIINEIKQSGNTRL